MRTRVEILEHFMFCYFYQTVINKENTSIFGEVVQDRDRMVTKILIIYSICVVNIFGFDSLGWRGRRDRMVVGFTTTYATNAYHH